MINEKYDPSVIEGKWQKIWEERGVFRAPDPSKDPKKRPKFYCLAMFPYPSGAIHMGHVRNYSIADVISRYKRMAGFNVLQPIGWDAFGLPAENAAILRKVHPRDWTLQNIAEMKHELQSLGISYDWDREIATCLPDYYRWEQVLFRRFYKEGLAYKKKGNLNWCDNCKTVLANEQVSDGKCWRCDGEVTLKEQEQWYFKITQYADQLLEDHEQLKGHWPSRVLEMQDFWIGKSEGAEIDFEVAGEKEKIRIFTTRADTLFGVTFLTISPYHPLAGKLCKTPDKTRELKELQLKVDRQKREEEVVKAGFFSGSYGLHPISQEKIPIWAGNFVVMEYGTGAVMGVPAHDSRDFEFAKQYELPIRQVIQSTDSKPVDAPYLSAGKLVASGNFNEMDSERAKREITKFLESKGIGKSRIQYRLRDWGISRQRYWGTPIPVIYCDDCGVVLVEEKDLPVELPYDVKFGVHAGNPLSENEAFVRVDCPKCKKSARRETDTMDTFIESSWYYARFTSPRESKAPFEKNAVRDWLPVDSYIGGIEHACMHLLYARFFHKVLRDWGYLSGDEPFASLITQGMVVKDGAKMSKSKGNVVTPESILKAFGADTARLFSMFAAPVEKDLDWNDKGVEGCFRFLSRVWRLVYHFNKELTAAPVDEKKLGFLAEHERLRRKTHRTIQKMTEELEHNKFNTAIAFAMELVNEIYSQMAIDESVYKTEAGSFVLREAVSSLVLLLSPFAPHLSEELWEVLGNPGLACETPWPTHQAKWLTEDSFLLVIQINGKVRDKIEILKSLSEEEVKRKVMELPKIQTQMEGKALRKFIYIPERIVNIVVG